VIDPQRWPQVKELFEGARELSGSERRDFLDRHCGSDAELRAELDSLLSTYDADSGFLETPALAGQEDLLAADVPDPRVGRRIGPYLVIRRIGEGGMGVVYEAVRADGQFRQRAAIKLVKRGMDSDFILRRFRHERQILAGLAHPNIGKLLDGGATEDGSPYFVMEYIDGELIDQYCRSRSLPARARVQLIGQVCAAVEHAHRQRIIHRDIKPGNILVDANGTPKLLDFGIAKLLDVEPGATVDLTVTGLRMITPEYASPEQTRGEPATERSDVYALGVVLYELLSGQRPTAPAVEILTEVPPIADVPRELNVIVRKAIHKDPARRYQTVRELSGDLASYLEGRPIAARPDSVTYRVKRSIRRHATVAWSIALVVVAIAAAGFSWFIEKGPLNGALSRGRRSVAVVGFQNVSGVPGAAWLSTALAEMLSAEVSANTRIRAIPGDSVSHMKTDLNLQPAGSYSLETLHRMRANLHPDYVITGSYMATGDKPDTLVRIDLRLQDVSTGESLMVSTDSGTYAELPAMATRAGTKLRESLGIPAGAAPASGLPSSPESARLYAEGLAHINAFDPLGARALLERAVAEDDANPQAHSALATALGQLGYEERAIAEAKRAHELSARLPEEKRLLVEAQYYLMQRKWGQAAAIYRRLWDTYPDNLDYAISLANTQSKNGEGQAARQTVSKLRDDPAAAQDGRVDLAAALADESLAEFKPELANARRGTEKARKAGARLLLAECLYYEAWAQWAMGDMAASEKNYREALQIYTETGHKRRVFDMTNGIASVLMDEGKAAESARMLESVLPAVREIGDRSMESTVSNNLGRCWEDLGQLTRAQAAYERGIALDRELNDRANLALGLMNAAGVIKNRGEIDLARERISEALDVARSVGRKSTIAIGLTDLADILYSRGDISGASKLQTEALTVAQEIGRKTSIASLMRDQGNLLRSQAKFDDAAAKYEAASRQAADANAASKVAEVRMCQAQLFVDQGQLAAAEKSARQALDEYRKTNDAAQAVSEALLGSILSAQGRIAEAQERVRSARERFGKSEVFPDGFDIEKAEARVAAAGGRLQEAAAKFRNLAAQARTRRLVELEWDAELDIARTELALGSKPEAAQRARRAEQAAQAAGFLRVAHEARSLH
jgi:serine/threonine protein kinase/tetratricopeptide (TPR) repeat protein/TolB-like protein